MPADQTLARARAELVAGETARARSRLRGLLSTYPERLDIRSALAQTYRAEGDVAQAGRWSYLLPDRDAAEVAAFLAATTDPVSRVRAMRWSGPEDAAGPWAEDQLVGLRTAAEEHTGGCVAWRADRPRPPEPSPVVEALASAGCFVVVALLVVLVAVGAVTVVRWVVGWVW